MAPRLLPRLTAPPFCTCEDLACDGRGRVFSFLGSHPRFDCRHVRCTGCPGRLDEWNERVATLANYALTSCEAGSILPAGFRSRASAGLEGVGSGDEEE